MSVQDSRSILCSVSPITGDKTCTTALYVVYQCHVPLGEFFDASNISIMQ